MDVLASAGRCLNTWANGGESECRNALIRLHSDTSDPDSINALTNVYYTILSAALSSWSIPHALSPVAFCSFMLSVLHALPSSSSQDGATTKSTQALALAELLVDLLWTVDARLDDIISDAKAIAAANQPDGEVVKNQPSEFVVTALKLKENAEKDKEVLADVLRRLLVADVLDHTICRQRLDLGLVASAGLIQDSASFGKKEIRIRTALFYKQNKFNLLREQSEGYSKLITELIGSLGPPHDPSTGRPVEAQDDIVARAQPAWQRVVSLIGYFDLDPNRALDIILDVFSVNLTTHWSFFLSLLDCSPWASAKSRTEMPEGKVYDKGVKADAKRKGYRGMELDEILKMAEEEVGAVPAVGSEDGNRVLAQVLGFKFSYYQSSEFTEPTPRSLYFLAALLIREGFMTLEDLYPHLTPEDAAMERLHNAYLTSVDTRIAGAKVNRLAMAAPLESGGKPSRGTPAPEVKKPDENADLPNHKLGITSALLAVGALRPALALLTKFPWLVDAHLEIADLMLRILTASISPCYDTAYMQKKGPPGFAEPRNRYTSTGVSPPLPRRPQFTLCAPTPPSTTAVDFVFFFPDWADRVPICRVSDDLVDVIAPLMAFVKVHISRDVLFLTKFLRLGRLHLAASAKDQETNKLIDEPDPEHPKRKFWLNMCRVYLLPALSLIRGNTVCSVEVWAILRQFDVTIRWRLYGEWKAVTYSRHPELRICFVQADRESKGILRRLSTQTVDSLSGPVAKLAHHNPMVFFSNAVNQVMAYDNLAEVVIKAMKFLTLMAHDVLVYVILDALSNPNKARLKDDGVNTTDWLQSLAAFTGLLYRTRPAADLNPLLKYIVHSLYSGQTSDIVILRELIWKMAGIEPLPTLSDVQVGAMAGGPTLRIEAIASTTRGARLDPTDSAVVRAPQRLGKNLLESSLALPLLIQVAQQRQACVFRAPDTHLKSLTSLFDTTHGVLIQYLECLVAPSVISSNDYSKHVIPPLLDLNEKYGIPLPICMIIYRPILNRYLMSAALKLQAQERESAEQAEKRLKAALTAKREPNAVSRVVSPIAGETAIVIEESQPSKVITTEDGATKDVAMDVVDATPSSVTPPVVESPWIPELAALFDDVIKIAPEATEVIGPGFYVTFWQLSTFDLAPPSSQYDEHCSTLRELYTIESNAYYAADRSNDRVKRAAASVHRAKRERINATIDALKHENKEQTTSRIFTLKRLAREKAHWFSHAPRALNLVSSIIEHCLQPRCLLSPMDADFCAQIVKVLHIQGTPYFWTLMCYNKLLGDHVDNVIFSCSEHEAKNYGRFLLGILSDLWKWHQDEQAYLVDNRTKISGKSVLLPGFQVKWTNKATYEHTDLNPWKAFQQVVKKWHRNLTQALCRCIESGEFMHVYNSIIVLKEILPVFPMAAVHEFSGQMLNLALEKFLEKEQRGDLKILGMSYQASLKKREKEWQPSGLPAPNAATKGVAPVSAGSGPRVSPAALNGAAHDGRRESNGPSASGTRAPATNGSSAKVERPPLTSGSARPSLDNIPRPEVVKRVRPESGRTTTPPVGPLQAEPMDIDLPSKPDVRARVSLDRRDSQTMANDAATPRAVPMGHSSDRPPSTVPTTNTSDGEAKLPPRPSASNGTPRNDAMQRQPSNGDLSSAMRPPTVPSQTSSAQELRETAKQTMLQRSRSEKAEDRENRSRPASPPSRRRTPSPATRPGTRNHSSESRTSGGSRTAGDERGDDKRAHRDQTGRRDGPAARPDRNDGGRRDKERERGGRDRIGDRDKERDRERGRRERDDERERERERDREREKDRDRERERSDGHRDRYRRDDKERERDRKDRDPPSRSLSMSGLPNAAADERGLTGRPEVPRRRPSPDEPAGKRRRPGDDDSDRGGKRGSRSHREDRGRDDRAGRRGGDKDHDRGREQDRRRKDREPGDGDSRTPVIDKGSERRASVGPASTPKPPPSAPSGPRAMAVPDGPRSGKPEQMREWGKAQPPRDLPPHAAQNGGASSASGAQDLRSRISDNAALSPRGHPRSPPRVGREPPPSDRRLDVPSGHDRDDSRKRTASERDKDAVDPTAPGEPQKRPKLQRSRYGPAAVLEEMGGGEKSRSRRKS